MPEGELARILVWVQGALLAAVSALAVRLWLHLRAIREQESPNGTRAEPGEGQHQESVQLRRPTLHLPSGPSRIDPRSCRIDPPPTAQPAKEPAPPGLPPLISVPRLGTLDDRKSVDALTHGLAELSVKHGAVWSMADAGRPMAEIARETGRTIGEIELILAVRRRIRDRLNGLPGDSGAGDPA